MLQAGQQTLRTQAEAAYLNKVVRVAVPSFIMQKQANVQSPSKSKPRAGFLNFCGHIVKQATIVTAVTIAKIKFHKPGGPTLKGHGGPGCREGTALSSVANTGDIIHDHTSNFIKRIRLVQSAGGASAFDLKRITVVGPLYEEGRTGDVEEGRALVAADGAVWMASVPTAPTIGGGTTLMGFWS